MRDIRRGRAKVILHALYHFCTLKVLNPILPVFSERVFFAVTLVFRGVSHLAITCLAAAMA